MKTNLLITIGFLLSIEVAFCQSSNVNLIKEWHHGHSFSAIYVNGNYAYLGSDVALNILDISNTSSIKVVSQIILPKTINWITYQSGKAYVATRDSGIRIIDVSNPLQPIESGFYQTQGKVYAVSVSGNYAYVANDTAGIRVLDVSNPASPFEVGFFDLGNTKANNVVVSGNYAYISYEYSGLQIVDISNPTSPVSVSFLDWSTLVFTVFVSGNYAYVLSDSLRIVDITNPLSPLQVGATRRVGSYNTLFVSGNYAYTFNNSSLGSYDIWDVSNPSAPSVIGSYDVNTNFNNLQSVFVNGAQAYFLKQSSFPGEINTLEIVDVSIPASPSLIGKFRQMQMFYDVCSVGNYVYTNDWEIPFGALIGVYDITNPSLPQQIGIFDDSSDYYAGMFVSGNYLYLTGGQTVIGSSSGVKIIDISNPSNPVKIGSYNISNTTALGISVSGTYAYVCFGSQGVHVINVSNPAAPVSVGSLTLAGGFPAIEIVVSGNYAYVTDNANKIHIVDVSNPTSPLEVGSYQLPADGSDIYVSGNYAYVAAGEQGLQIIDVINPTSPVLAGTYSSVGNDSRLELYKVGSYVYLADFLNGLQVIDVSNPASPVQVGYFYNISAYARNVYADNNNIYLVSDYGFYIFNNTFVTNTNFPDDIKNNFLLLPNPFSSQTVLKTDKLLNSATLTVYNCLGETIAQTKNISGQSITFNRNNLPSGLYFYRLTEENKTIATDKLIITDK